MVPPTSASFPVSCDDLTYIITVSSFRSRHFFGIVALALLYCMHFVCTLLCNILMGLYTLFVLCIYFAHRRYHSANDCLNLRYMHASSVYDNVFKTGSGIMTTFTNRVHQNVVACEHVNREWAGYRV
jgi:hypothetical protein